MGANPMAGIAAELAQGRAGLRSAPKAQAPEAALDGMGAALSQIKSGAFQLRKATPASTRFAATDDLIGELKAKSGGGGRYGLRATGMRSKSGRLVVDSDRKDGLAGNPAAELNLRAGLRKPARKPEPEREMTELEKVREKMANKMKRRLQEIEQQDVEDSWADEQFGGPGQV